MVITSKKQMLSKNCRKKIPNLKGGSGRKAFYKRSKLRFLCNRMKYETDFKHNGCKFMVIEPAQT